MTNRFFVFDLILLLSLLLFFHTHKDDPNLSEFMANTCIFNVPPSQHVDFASLFRQRGTRLLIFHLAIFYEYEWHFVFFVHLPNKFHAIWCGKWNLSRSLWDKASEKKENERTRIKNKTIRCYAEFNSMDNVNFVWVVCVLCPSCRTVCMSVCLCLCALFV